MSHHPFKREVRKSNNEGALVGGGGGETRAFYFVDGVGGIILKGTVASF